jgi:hypothetical protein
MRDARWYDVESEIADAVQHFDKAARGYNSFDPSRAAPALEAARQLASELPEAIAAFQKLID